ncbi:MAG: RNA polymerase sigma factor [Phycisphaerae bacterium]
MIAPRDSWNLPLAPCEPDPGSDWLARLHAEHGPGLKRLLRRMIRHEEDVQDAYQDCLHRLARRNPIGPPQRLHAYAYRTAANLAIEVLRRRRRRAAHFQHYIHYHRLWHSQTAPPSDSADGLNPSALRRGICALPQHLRDVLVLRELAGLSYHQVSTMLNIQINSARVYRRQAIVRLARKLNPVTRNSKLATRTHAPLTSPQAVV